MNGRLHTWGLESRGDPGNVTTTTDSGILTVSLINLLQRRAPTSRCSGLPSPLLQMKMAPKVLLQTSEKRRLQRMFRWRTRGSKASKWRRRSRSSNGRSHFRRQF
jgi:hypothetical protein